MFGYPRAAWLSGDDMWLQVLHPDECGHDVRPRSRAPGGRVTDSFSGEYRIIAPRRAHRLGQRDGGGGDRRGHRHRLLAGRHGRRDGAQAGAGGPRGERAAIHLPLRGGGDRRRDDPARRGRIDEANGMLEQRRRVRAGCACRPAARCARRPGRPRESRSSSRGSPQTPAISGELEHRLVRQDGSLIWCRTVLTLVRDDTGAPSHVIGMLEDISDRKREEAAISCIARSTTGSPGSRIAEQFLDRLRSRGARVTTGRRTRRAPR